MCTLLHDKYLFGLGKLNALQIYVFNAMLNKLVSEKITLRDYNACIHLHLFISICCCPFQANVAFMQAKSFNYQKR